MTRRHGQRERNRSTGLVRQVIHDFDLLFGEAAALREAAWTFAAVLGFGLVVLGVAVMVEG